jgi:hypothetical protein
MPPKALATALRRFNRVSSGTVHMLSSSTRKSGNATDLDG